MSNSSLYGNTGNVTVSANNLTTLYNSTPSNVVTANVPARNFTTLYTQQSDIRPTTPYGNSNVEAFLNVGHDSGGNVVQNINMSGNLTVGGQSFLGNVTNVHIDGGTLNFVLTTDGNGGLSWTEQDNGNATPYIHFDVTTTANNQQFTDILLANYLNADDFNVMKNGVNIEPTLYQKINSTTLQVDILLNNGDSIDVLASGAGGTASGGNITEVQYNGGSGLFSGNSSFTFDQANSKMTVGNVTTENIIADTINVSGTSNLGFVSNVTITGGSVNYVLRTDGAGNLSWTSLNTTAPGGNNTYVQFNDGGTFGGSANLTFNKVLNLLSANYFEGNGTYLTSLTGANVTGTVANATYATTAGSASTATSATTAGYAVTAGTVVTGAQPNITSTGTLVNLTVSDNTSVNNITSTGNVTIQRAFELVTPNSTGSTGTINFDVITQSIINVTSNATANCTVNIRGNSSVSLNTLMPVNESLTIVYLNKVGSTAYIVNQLQIDSNNITPIWLNGSSPTIGIRTPNAVQSYTYTIIKTASGTYTVLASLSEFV